MLQKCILKLVCGVIVLVSLSSCAVVKATNQPGKKDLSVLRLHTPRSHVIAELGKPVNTQIHNGKRTDIYSFVQGYSKGNKAARAIGHGVADVFTLGLWEVAGTPLEGIANGRNVQVEVTYGKTDHVEKVNYIKGLPSDYTQTRRLHR
ncbi:MULTISPECIES: hypothetical protein [unclassified Legionella]|uniref:hypothetical protein n=1 Tax=Legionella sp. PC997 TaxID=2755562 RepID=UPI001862E2BE|nr:hypothetical protein [Legionella sp. PC997]QMT60031.1 hypothetical protein HBNCFIEN_01401 [Legionella sp. PC997]